MSVLSDMPTTLWRFLSCTNKPLQLPPDSVSLPCLIARLIFKSLGIRCVPFLDQIVPYLLQVARKCGPGLRESILQQLSLLTSIVHHNIAPFLPTLFDIIRDYWTEHQEHILTLGETDSDLLFSSLYHRFEQLEMHVVLRF
jgi:phosphatidylinositol kinase/protein kinase (PI-3  family)